MTTRLEAAFAAVPRADFLPPSVRDFAHVDEPLPIGHGATNSQPWTVHYMLRHLDVRPGDRVLDVGSGSGWTTALLGHLTGETGSVIGVDLEPDLVAMGRANLGQRFAWVRFEVAVRGVLGWPDEAPYDRILVSADAGRVPPELEEQLAVGGRMVLPAAQAMVVVERGESGEITRTPTDGRFSFVPLR
ncbi:protein-L-isoaspartate O-methyltransferase family protein [Raineyella fluvialis]|uniref:Protein-L-isoaspartate O-methyltransferase n=1 Tax=Raineyella fluvialis TaxID=2662261 RepID=A0A5Q2FDX4_9ACTN|nr:protein-L-isoaspartate O-methyltransferase [Raineyella fluvialis]QGF22466.1 methyltransferase domain-containing protein [Raineyella fluvialis]